MVTGSTTAKDKVTIGTSNLGPIQYYYSKAAQRTAVGDFSNTGLNIGTFSESVAYTNYSEDKAMGVLGIGGGALNGSNFGIVGMIINSYGQSTNGAAVYGTNSSTIASSFSGSYAGYFDGATYVNGSITANQHLTPSDLRLKESISALYDDGSDGNALKDILSIGVYKFTYKDQERSRTPLIETNDKGTEVDSAAKSEKKLHFGLVAQELKEIFPNLVEEGQDGYLSVNYVELVPVLIQSIKELNQKVEELSANSEVAMAKEMTGVNATTASANKLFQNTSNPFKEATVIRFTLAEDAADAAICIFDMTGKQLKRIPVTVGMDSVTINGGDLGAGMFLYSLIVDGQEIDTKRMILS